MGNDYGVTNGTFIVLVDGKVERSHVDVADLLALGLVNYMVKGSRFSPPTKESIAGYRRVDDVKVRQEGTEFWLRLDHPVPLTLP